MDMEMRYWKHQLQDGGFGWFSDYANFPDTDVPFVVRGGACSDGSGAGMFYFNGTIGGGSSFNSFRVVLASV